MNCQLKEATKDEVKELDKTEEAKEATIENEVKELEEAKIKDEVKEIKEVKELEEEKEINKAIKFYLDEKYIFWKQHKRFKDGCFKNIFIAVDRAYNVDCGRDCCNNLGKIVSEDFTDENAVDFEFVKIAYKVERIGIEDEEDKEILKKWKKFKKENFILNLYKYEHGNVIFECGNSNPFHCNWDSGQVGIIYCSYADLAKEFPEISISKEKERLEEKAEKIFDDELKVFTADFNGEQYSISVLDEDLEVMDLCTGFYCLDDDFEKMIEDSEMLKWLHLYDWLEKKRIEKFKK